MADMPIVLDGGTGFLKVGYAAQNFPEHQFPSIVGRPILRTEEQAGDIVVKDIMCGDEAAAARSMLQISYPVCRPCVVATTALPRPDSPDVFVLTRGRSVSTI
jgi:actin-related protein